MGSAGGSAGGGLCSNSPSRDAQIKCNWDFPNLVLGAHTQVCSIFKDPPPGDLFSFSIVFTRIYEPPFCRSQLKDVLLLFHLPSFLAVHLSTRNLSSGLRRPVDRRGSEGRTCGQEGQ